MPQLERRLQAISMTGSENRGRRLWVSRRHWSNSTEWPLLSALRSRGREGRVSAVEPPLIGSGRTTGYGHLRPFVRKEDPATWAGLELSVSATGFSS